jgi:hypothetical protein
MHFKKLTLLFETGEKAAKPNLKWGALRSGRSIEASGRPINFPAG